MNKYDIRTNKKKKSIVDAALNLFSQNGFIGVSIKDIAELANVSPVSIYNYYGSKEALVHACTLVLMDDILKKSENILLEDIPFKEKILKAFDLCTLELNENLHTYIQSSQVDDKLIKLMIDSINQIKIDIYSNFIDEGQKVLAIDPEIARDSILILLKAINQVGISLEAHQIQKTQSDIKQLLLYGLLVKD